MKKKRLANLTETDWISLCRRVEAGMATQGDARHVEKVGMMPQAIRIRQGLATRSDAVLVHLQVQIRMHGDVFERLQQAHCGALA